MIMSVRSSFSEWEDPIPVIQYGLGPIGCGVARLAARRSNLRLIAAVDIDPNKIGRDVGEVIGLERPLGLPVAASLQEALKIGEARVAFHTTGSRLPRVAGQLKELMQAGLAVVSTCEELAFPYVRNPEIAADLDRVAEASGVAILGTGVNPGFVMDTLALVMTSPCQEVKRITIVRNQDASPRREPLQRKVGAGLTVAEFEKKVQDGSVRHMGLPESLDMVAAGLGWKLDRSEDWIGPIIANRTIRTQYLEVHPGQVAGVHQIGRGYIGDRLVITLELKMAVGVDDPHDGIEIEGTPNVSMRIAGGLHGDLATAAMVVNAASRILTVSPGLHTMLTMPILPSVGV